MHRLFLGFYSTSADQPQVEDNPSKERLKPSVYGFKLTKDESGKAIYK